MRLVVLIFICLFPAFLAFADDSALADLTLKQTYQLALARSETVAIQAEVIKQAEGRFLQSLSAVLPEVSFIDAEKWQDSATASSGRQYVPQRRFVFTQPLFSGFKEFAGIAAAKAEERQRKAELQRAQQLLFTDVADAFYLMANYQQDLETLRVINQSLANHIVELKRRQRLGRCRLSEVANMEARFYLNLATIESAQGSLEVAQQLLEFLVGRPVASLANDHFVPDQVAAVDTYAALVPMRADVVAARSAVTVAQKQLVVARAGYFPTVDAVANQYVKRSGTDQGDWDFTFNINVPLFTGTLTAGEVKTAKAKARTAELVLSRTQRQAELEIRNAYTRLVQSQKQTEAYQKAVDAARHNYDLQEIDFRNFLVNSLDVLKALEDLEEVLRSHTAVKNETLRFYWNLKVASGDINDDAF